MPQWLDSLLVALIITLVVAGFIWRALRHRKSSGCGGGCCSSATIKKRAINLTLDRKADG